MKPWIVMAAVAAVLAAPSAGLAQPAGPAVVDGVGVDEHIGAPLPLALVFEDTARQPVRLGDVLGNGKPAILVLAYNRCAMLCSLVLRGVVKLMQETDWVPGEDLALVEISIDPRETPDESARTQQQVLEQIGHPAQPERWPFLVGDEAAIAAVADAIGFRYRWDDRSEQFAHPAVITIISPDGKVAGYFYGLGHEPDQVAAVLRGEEGASDGSVASAILSCFRFDSLARRYGGLIGKSFQVGAALVLGFVVVVVVRSLRKGRAR